jgi:hypothetical protein
MDLLTAHAHFALRADRSILPCEPEIETGAGPIDGWPAVATALASMSGALDDAQDDEDLDEAVKHGLSLVAGDIFTPADVLEEASRVILEIMRWGDELCVS